jgi:hypothetical protein
MTSRRTNRALALVLALVIAHAPAAPLMAQTPAPPTPDVNLAEGVWPRQFDANGTTVLVYQPQIDKWEQNRLEARAAVSLQAPGAPQPSFGVIWITARTEVDKERGIVSLEDIKIPKVNFPGAPPGAQERYLRVAREHLPGGVRTVPLEQFEANLAVTQAGAKTAGLPIKNDPPRIIVSSVPALLVRVDGTPSLRQVQGSPLLRVINTPALMLLDPATGRYYLAAGGGWLEAAHIEGPWAPSAAPPASLDAARQTAMAAGPVDLLPTAPGQPPPSAIYVSSVPSELIETAGAPTWSPVPGTELLYATNTKAHLFLELRTQLTYVLISGRWFRARSTDGPWEYIPGSQLSPDFAKIPEQSPAGAVLASVPGTQQAQEAVIANSIPQTATVNRSAAHFTATYDGPPQWIPISGVPLQYAFNSPTPIIRVDAKTYYALYNAVWFVATSPAGPWMVATVVPSVIYTIPVTSPLHYVTYVRVYSATSTVVYVGYTPGYLGTVVAPDGVVVYGTGVVYTPWVGAVWYPPPPTYGFGAGFAWGATTGFMMGAVAGSAMWGCCGSSTTTNVNVNKTVTNVNTSSSSNVYNNWSKTTVSSGSKSATEYKGPDTKVVTNNQNNNVYASHDGNAYKKQDGQWEKWGGSGTGWQPVQTPSQKSGSTSTSSTPASTTSQSPSAKSPSSQSSSQNRQQERQQSTSQGSEPRSSQSTSQAQPGSQERAGQRQGGSQTSSQGLGSSSRTSGGQSSSRFGSGSSQSFSNRFSGGGMQGLENESASRDRGFERFSGSRGGGGFFRR